MEIEANWCTVKGMYDYASTNSLKLLSDYSADFWQDYLTYSNRYDKMFMRMYKSYRYYMQDPYKKDADTVDEITEDFIDAVYMHLKMNDKKYSELYKINVLNNDLSITNDFSITESMDGTKAYDGTYVNGQRSDATTENEGQRSDVTVKQIEGFNSSEFDDSDRTSYQKGSQSNSSSYSKGSQTNTDEHSESNVYELETTGYKNNPTDNLRKHKNFWDGYDFMNYIFKNICADLLLV